ncbi:MAG: hypothetical protein DWQ01_21570 [Planctomycetota bacterium]|nr:MAG: hypothetical protein DWQ01_21570 [Planctomycetota bacterium]
MKRLPLRLLAGGLVLSAASTMVVMEQAQAYSTLGHSLGLAQRDVRLYDEFGAGAHTNSTPEPNMPGYTEAALAVWKGVAEWGHTSFGDGSGDPLQSNIGDGGANFNPLWNGFASGEGPSSGNITAGLTGSSGGVLAYMTGGGSGWRIYFYVTAWNWKDNPNSASGGFDIQAVMCHEYGHALGLGHSSSSQATMYPSIGTSSTKERSINSDDQNGVQAVYGALDPTKIPYISSVTGSTSPGGTAVVNGSNFTNTANRIWFNSSTLDGNQTGGDPYEISGLDSTNGQTQISFTVPSSGIEDGGLHVRKGGSGHDRLSNGWPFDYDGATTNTIFLSGPTSTQINQTESWTFTGAPASSPWWFYYSFNANGTTINGQPFDIGSPYFTAGTGMTDAGGNGFFTKTIPPGGAGRTAYLEVRCDSGGTTYDSNMLTLVIQ